MTIAARVAAVIGAVGQQVTYRQTAGIYEPATRTRTPTTPVDYTVPAAVRKYQAREIVGDIQQGDREVRIGAVDLNDGEAMVLPDPGDRIVIGGHETTIESVNTRSVSGVPAIHIIQVRG